MAIISWLGLVLGYHKYRGDQDESETADDDHLEDAAEAENADTDEDTDSQQRDVDYQTQPAPLGGTSDDNTTDSTPDTTTSSRQLTQSSLLRSNDEIIDEVEDKLDDYVQFYNDESIEIADNDLNLYSRMMLEVIVKRLKYEYGSTDTPKMTVEELREAIGKNRYDRNNIEVLLFLEAARDWLTPPYRATDIDYAELNETTFTVELKNLSEAVDWTLNDQWDYVGLPSSLRTAAAALNDARNRYESLKEKEDTGYYPVHRRIMIK